MSNQDGNGQPNLVNWVDGMKIKKDHFVITENYFNTQQRNLRYHSKRNGEFGILPSFDGYNPLQLQLSHDELILNKCIAVTGNGSFIEINEENRLTYSRSAIKDRIDALNNSKLGVYVVIQADVLERTPVGEPDPEEVPLRKPYSSLKYHLDIMPESQLNKNQLASANYVVVAKVISDGAVLRVDDRFIPPCTHVMNNELLSDYYDKWLIALERTNKNAILVCNKILSKPQKKVLDNSLLMLSQNMMTQISSKIDFIALSKKDISPVELLAFGLGYARVIRNTIESIFKNEELINYVCQYISADPALFKKFIESDVLGMNYNVLNLSRCFRLMDKLIESFDHIYNTLPSLSYKQEGNLDFIVD